MMSNIKVGDKVRFLNSTGGGVVRSFKGKDQVLVEDEDGFEVPALIRECVVVGDSEMQVHSSRRSPLPSVTQAAVPQPKKPEPQPEVEKVTETIEGERLNIYLAYLPIEPAKVIQGSGYETYFINDSNYYLFFNYMNRQNNSWISRYNGIVEPNTQIFLEEFGKEELNDLERICVQLIAFKKDKPYSLKNAISVELHLDTVKFYKQHCFMENDFFDEDAMVYPIVRQDIPEKELLISAAELQQAMQQKVHEDRRVPQTIVKKKVTDSSILEVDLHITELLDNTNGLSNADMLAELLKVNKSTLGTQGKKQFEQITSSLYPTMCQKLFATATANYDVANYDTAISNLDQIMQMDQGYNDGKAMLLLAQCYEKQNKTGKANTYYQKIVDKYSGKEAATTAQEALNKQNKQN